MDRDLFGRIWPLFSAEAREHLQTIGDGVLELERFPGDAERLDAVRRVAHSLKGSAASLGLGDVEAVAHAIEDSLARFDATNGLSRAGTIAILDAVAAVEEALGLADGGGEGSVPRVEEILSALSGGGGGPERVVSERLGPSSISETIDRLAELLLCARSPDDGPERRSEAAARGAELAAQIGVDRPEVAAAANRLAAAFPRILEGGVEGARAAAEAAGRIVEIRQGTSARPAAPSVVPAAATGLAGGTSPTRPSGEPSELRERGERSIRVPAGTVDSLLHRIELLLSDLGGLGRRGREMTSVEAALGEALSGLDRATPRPQDEAGAGPAEGATEAVRSIAAVAAQAGKLGRDAVRDAEALRLAAIAIREDLRSLRMVPAAALLHPLRRTARDAAVRLGKEVELILHGEDVRIDRQALDALRDPLVHIVRNAVDHGIEPPETRTAAGKPARGSVAVRVEPRGARVGIVIEDDGAGIDLERLRESAIRRGAVAEAAAAAMSPREIAQLAFLPGISTAREVTTLSGRGVGLDVVHAAVVALRGRIDLSSSKGTGTRFDIDLPLSLSTTLGLVLRVGREMAILPADAVERVVRVGPADVGRVAGRSTVEVARAHLPFAPLAHLVGQGSAQLPPAAPALVLAVGAIRGVVAVDELLGLQEVVVRPLGPRASSVTHLGGAVILDDRGVVPVLNVGELLRRMREGEEAPAKTPRARIVVADDSLTTRSAMKSLLEVAGYEVTAAQDGQEALEIVRRTGCDLVVSDVQMPRLDGLSLARAVKSDPRLSGIPVVLVTSLGSAEDRAAGLSAGADGYLVKRDVQAGKLLELVGQLLPARG